MKNKEVKGLEEEIKELWFTHTILLGGIIHSHHMQNLFEFFQY